MSKRTAKVKTRPRKPVFDRALEDAQRRLVKAKEKRQKCQDGLVWTNNEIPRLEKIIQALGGTSDIGRGQSAMEAIYSPERIGKITGSNRDIELLPDLIQPELRDEENQYIPDIK